MIKRQYAANNNDVIPRLYRIVEYTVKPGGRPIENRATGFDRLPTHPGKAIRGVW